MSSVLGVELQWLSVEDVALAWNKPIGVLYDLIPGRTPWRLEGHSDPNPDYILPKMDMEQYWLNQLKESSYIHNGNAKQVMGLSKQDSSMLWEGVKLHDFVIWRRVYDKLKLGYKRLPLRVYLNDSRLDRVVEFNGQTLGDVIREVVPELYDKVSVVIHGIPSPPMESPIRQLFHECVYIDGFLHICCVLQEGTVNTA